MFTRCRKINSNLSQNKKLQEFFRFCLIGLAATLIHYGIYYAIIKGCDIETELWLNIAYSIGYVISWCCNLWLTAHFTFRTEVNVKRGVGFAISHGINYLLHITFLNLFLWVGLSATTAPWVVFCCVVPINFLLVRTVFKKL